MTPDFSQCNLDKKLIISIIKGNGVLQFIIKNGRIKDCRRQSAYTLLHLFNYFCFAFSNVRFVF